MSIQEIKAYMKANRITQIRLAEISGVPLQTLRDIFSGATRNPRLDTVQAIEKALGLDKELSPNEKAAPALTDKEERLIKAFNVLIPPMQDYILEMTENLVQKQNPQSGSATGAGKKHA